MPLDSDFQQWVGRSQHATDTVTAMPIKALAATLNIANRASQLQAELPPLWHWLYFLPTTEQSHLGEDGHAKRGDFLPPISLPRRMWAGSQLQFHHFLTLGDQLQRRSSIESVSEKSGRSGKLVFVKVKHQIQRLQDQKTMITDYHDIVYREPPSIGTAEPSSLQANNKSASAVTAQWEEKILADDILLFRYSALTFNAHRIHYDRRYVTEQEGYPGLVVHGPLIATLLLNAMNRQLDYPAITRFEFKALSPVFDTAPFWVCGAHSATEPNTVLLWARHENGALAMQATATLANT